MQYPDNQIITVTYTNYRGETADRQIVPIKVWFGTSQYHPEPQWLLDAYDIGKQAERSFALRDIQDWK